MIHDPEYVKDLLQKQVKGRATPTETALLLLAFDLYSEEEITEMFTRIDLSVNEEELRQHWPPPSEEEAKQWLQQRKEAEAASRRRRRRIRATVYSIVAGFFGLLAGLFLYLVDKEACNCGYIQSRSTEISTAPYPVQIRLSSDAVHTIDSPGLGRAIQDGPLQITTPEPGLLVYSYTPGAQQDMGGPSFYHTLATTTGGQYRVVLPDGSTVRLNAASTLRFPLSFSDSRRRVELRGEALFEVASHRQPFVVQLRGAELQGSGSRFNVKAYTPAAVATLLDGSLAVKTARDYLLLEGGEEALFETIPGSQAAARLLRRTADTAQAVSWKTVQRFYTNVPVREIVADMARWYNLRISNLACVPDRRVTTEICYNATLEEMFGKLREMGLHFVAKGKAITFCNPLPAAEGMALLKSE